MSNTINVDDFWHLVSEIEPPVGKLVWVTTNPFKIPAIRADSWNGPGTGWVRHGNRKDVYWAFPIIKQKQGG